jgi:HK97 family phage prohead protease
MAEVLIRAELLVRAAGTLERLDRSTLVGRYVPWDIPAHVVDPTPTGVERYQEGFRRGAADRQLHGSAETKRFIAFVDQHDGGLGKIGYTLDLSDEPDGLYGHLRVLPRYLDDVETMIGDGITGLSVGFRPLRHRVEDGVTWRTAVLIEHVALEPLGAYPGAEVVAWRTAADELAAAEAVDLAERAARRTALAAWLDEQEAAQAAFGARVGQVQPSAP